ncbi:MAG: alpha-(1-_3)-arabinofuranosyltransferase family protein, partial [Actinomycetota bacterium]
MTSLEVPTHSRRPRPPKIGVVALLAVAYIPLLLTRPGEVGADTKTYLYLAPGRLLSRAAWMWDTSIGAGTVTHQNIGYLWPMGPYYWLLETLGVPDWIAQRLWLGTIIAAAGLGVRFMLRELRWAGAGVTVASFAYALSPYLLHYGARISVILLPFAGLPWLVGLASRSVRLGGWRWPAVFALLTVTVGGVNATSLLLVMAGPLLWMLYAVCIDRSVTWNQTITAGLRITVLTLATSVWWIAGLALQGTYGIPILRYTETYATVANASVSTEILRGLGYWFFYGRDALGSWISAAERMTNSVPALVLSFLVPGLALVAAVATRFKHRAYFAVLVAVGVLIGVGAHPWDEPSPAGSLFRAWTGSDAGLAFRSTPRAIPLVALGLAVFLGAGVAAISRSRPAWQQPVAAGVLVLLCLNQWALFGGELVDRNLRRPQELPSYWLEAARTIDQGDDETRILEVPGTDFASYRWGETVDPITPGLIDRPYLARELIPYGTPASANLLNALDLPFQQGTADPTAIAPLARLFGIGAILHRGDLQYERFRTPRPDRTAAELAQAPGLTPEATFGDDVPNDADPRLPLVDEVELGEPPLTPTAPALSLFAVDDPEPIARTVAASAPTLMAGDGAGIVNWAAANALDPASPILYSATFADDPDRLRSQADQSSSQLVVTDTNRRSARRWGSVRENEGVTEQAGEKPIADDPTDNRLDVFPDGNDDSATVTEQIGGSTVQASSYGNPVSYTPADRAARAMDGDPATAWRVAAFGEPRGEFLEIAPRTPATADHLTLLQPQRQANRWITEVELSFDDGEPVVVALDESSRTVPGQRVEFPQRAFERLRITITETDVGRLDRYV